MLSSLIPSTALHPPATHCLMSTRTHILDSQVLGFLYPQSGPRGPHPVSWGHPRPHTWILKTSLLWPLDSYHSQLIWYFTDHTPSPWAPPSYYLVPLSFPTSFPQQSFRTHPEPSHFSPHPLLLLRANHHLLSPWLFQDWKEPAEWACDSSFTPYRMVSMQQAEWSF